MARTAALIKASIWDVGSDFRKLSSNAQRLYMLLLSQPQITNCGVLPYTPERWARMAGDDTLDQVTAAADELAAARYVLVDHGTRELLIRTFIKHDRILEQPNLVKAAQREFQQIESDTLRDAITATYPDVFGTPAADHREATGRRSGTPQGTPTGTPSPTPSTGGSSSRTHDRTTYTDTSTDTDTGVEKGSNAAAANQREPAPADAAADELRSLLAQLKVGKQLRTDALTEPGRALACAKLALTEHGIRNRGGYFRTLWESGDTPERTDGSPPPRPLLDIATAYIKAGGAFLDWPDALAHLQDIARRRSTTLTVEQLSDLQSEHAAARYPATEPQPTIAEHDRAAGKVITA